MDWFIERAGKKKSIVGREVGDMAIEWYFKFYRQMAQTISTYKLITLASSLADILIRNSLRWLLLFEIRDKCAFTTKDRTLWVLGCSLCE